MLSLCGLYGCVFCFNIIWYMYRLWYVYIASVQIVFYFAFAVSIKIQTLLYTEAYMLACTLIFENKQMFACFLNYMILDHCEWKITTWNTSWTRKRKKINLTNTQAVRKQNSVYKTSSSKQALLIWLLKLLIFCLQATQSSYIMHTVQARFSSPDAFIFYSVLKS